MMSIVPFIVATGLMLVIGLGCLMFKRDMVRLLIGVEILFNAANLFFIALATQSPLDGTVIAVGLAMVLNVYKHYKTIDIRKLRRLKW
jgi:NADH-quinone oxidoreductase subunit K